jgi:hypothetical protein
MDEKNPLFWVFLIQLCLHHLLGLTRFHLQEVIFRGNDFLIEMRQGRLSIKKSPWFDFFTASPHQRKRHMANGADAPSALGCRR